MEIAELNIFLKIPVVPLTVEFVVERDVQFVI